MPLGNGSRLMSSTFSKENTIVTPLQKKQFSGRCKYSERCFDCAGIFECGDEAKIAVVNVELLFLALFYCT